MGNYNLEYAEKYDQLWRYSESLFQPQLRLALQKLEIKQKPLMLDVGCGAGHHTLFLEKSFDGKTIGIDIAIGMLKQVQKKGVDIRLLRACGENIPLVSNVVDLLFISYVLHQSEEKYKFISEVYRVLKRSGHIAILTSSHSQLRGDLVHQYFPGILEINLKRFPSLDEIKEMLSKAGFKETSSSEISIKKEASVEEIVERIKGKPMSVFKLLSEKDFQRGLRTFEKKLELKYKEKITYTDAASLITATKPV
jgi:ubiquinone/menaquinone biosynthesis C-methylase UbiE